MPKPDQDPGLLHARSTPGLALSFVAGVAAGLSLMGLLSAAGAWSRFLDLLNHVTPLFALGGIAAVAIGWLTPGLPGARALAVLGLAGALGAGARAAPEWLQSLDAAPRPGPSVTVLTQNVWEANQDPHATAAALAGSGADIILLQELNNPRARLVARDLERAYPFHADCTLANRWCSLAIVSRLPISAWSFHQGGWKAPDWDRLAMVRAQIDAPGLPLFDVVSSKLAHPWTGDLQRTQIPRLVAVLKTLDQDHAVLGGDFNLTPWSFALRRFDRQAGLVRRTHGLATWPNRLPTRTAPLIPAPLLPIDQVYAGRGWRTVSVRRGPRTGSDHFGVLVTLSPVE
ncbi:endonuclease/exonuclease/phosphatase family protein [Phenylobacterium montanum]|uniref:Endonuclease/exonuclease/phosphatase family protein n=1 Tax=Phenylobacterium montanum TaxID=2823693 RepID=A0A975ITS0_9CAUL|nr:endonuclease/exonuclease/phosphatase family protein [Caulobacter sp. S6]QUD87015.1 endonuclease/exonuclease/phosphatase family protein [Caulobacter sp. S6]